MAPVPDVMDARLPEVQERLEQLRLGACAVCGEHVDAPGAELGRVRIHAACSFIATPQT